MFLYTEKKYLESLQNDIDLNDHFPREEIEFLMTLKKRHQVESRVNKKLAFINDIKIKTLANKIL